MSKIPIKRMYDVIAELQNEPSSSLPNKNSTTTPTATCTRLATAMLAGLSHKKVRTFRKENVSTQTTTREKVSSDKNPMHEHDVGNTTAANRKDTEPPQPQQDGAKEPKNATSQKTSYNSHLNHIPEDITHLRGVYLYGLQTVSALQDLQHAPDAILPGNLVLEEEYELTTTATAPKG